ncbi:MAG TPA: hypothetical protein VHD32_18080 [Candidatus Didemnitutus sp.]|nr:hypothetical protein [Candidatus Didemnitutus sp.]
MKLRSFLLPYSTILAVLALRVAAADSKPVAPPPITELAGFVGGVWMGDLPPEKDGPQMHIELRFAWTDDKQSLRFESAFVRGDRKSPYVSGMYAWNPGTKKYVIFYTDFSGSLVQGPVAKEDDVLVHDLTIVDATGKADAAQVRLHRTGPDDFINTIFVRKNDAWEKFVEVHYHRTP